MKICLYHPSAQAAGSDDAASYVGRLASALQQDHQLTMVSSHAALRAAMARERPDLLHVHQSAGLSLARLLSGAHNGQFDRVPIALTLHDYRLCCVATDLRHRDGRGCAPRLRCRMVAGLNRVTTDSVGLVHSPSQYVLDQHLQRGFFRQAAHLVLPYAAASRAGDPVTSADASTSYVVVRALSPGNAPLAIQDAFQSGAVVIASRAGGIPELVHDGVNGLLVAPGDEGAIARAIERLRTSPDLARRLRTEAGKTARMYDISFHAAHLTEAYTRLIAANRVGPFFRKAA